MVTSDPRHFAALLGGVLDPNNASRIAAEEELERLSYDPAFWEQICSFCGPEPPQKLPSAGLSRCQLVALSVLKQKLPLRSPPSLICSSVVQAMCHSLSSPSSMSTNVANQTCAVIGKCIALLEERCDASSHGMAPVTGAAEAVQPPTPPPLEVFSATSGMVLTQIQTALQPSASHVSVTLRHRFLLLLSEVLQAATARSVMWSDAAQLAPLLVQAVLAAYGACLSPADAVRLPFPVEGNEDETVMALNCGIAAVGILQDLLFHSLTPSTTSGLLVGEGNTADVTDCMVRVWAEHMSALLRIALAPCSTLPPLTTTTPTHPPLPHPLCLSLSYGTLTLLTDGLSSREWLKRVGSSSGATQTPELCVEALASLQADLPLYMSTLSLDTNGSAVDEDPAVGESMRLLHGHCVKRWWCLSLASVHAPVRTVLQRRLCGTQAAATSSMAQLWVLLFAYCPLSDLALAVWEEDVNAFLRDEEACEDGLGAATRDAAVCALKHLTSVFGPGFLVYCLEHANALLFSTDDSAARDEETLTAISALVPTDCRRHADQTLAVVGIPLWKWREAALFCLAYAVRHCQKTMSRCGPIDLHPVVQQILAVDAGGAAAHPVQVARALSCIGALLPYTAGAADSTAQVVACAISSITDCDAGGGSFVQLAACKLLLDLFTRAGTPASAGGIAVATFDRGHRAVLHLLTQHAAILSGESLYLVLDLMNRWLMAAEVTAIAPNLPEVVFHTWRAHVDDPNLNDSVTALLRLVIRRQGDETYCDASLAAQVPWMDAVIQGQCSLAEQCVLPSVVQIIGDVFRYGSAWLADTTASQLLSHLCEALLRAEESAIVDAAANCLAALLKRCPQAEQVSVSASARLVQSASSSAPPLTAAAATRSGVAEEPRTAFPLSTVLVAVALHLLREDRPEASLFRVGPALRAIAQAAPQCTEEEVRAFLLACARRLITARTDTVATQLVTPLSLLTVRYPEAVTHTLVQTDLLESVVAAWLPHVPGRARYADLCLSCDSLLALLRVCTEGGVRVTLPQSVLAQQKTVWQTTHTRASSEGERVPLALAVFATLGRAIVALSVIVANGTFSSTGSDDDNDAGLFHDSDDMSEDEEGDDEDFVDVDIDDGDEWADEDDVMAGRQTLRHETIPTASHGPVDPNVLTMRRAELRRIFSNMVPLVPEYGMAAAPLFKQEELVTIQDFFNQLSSDASAC